MANGIMDPAWKLIDKYDLLDAIDQSLVFLKNSQSLPPDFSG